MNEIPFISVVMPVYNCAEYLREAIESILSQTFKNFEFIIINDGSTDKTEVLLNEYANKDFRIKTINQLNSGIVVALNRGLSEAKGEWIFRMDGDDVALPHRFAIQIEAIERNPSLVLLGSWCRQINSKGDFLKINKYPTIHAKLVNRVERGLSFFPHSSACFRRDAVMNLGGYRERFRHAEDVDLWLRLSNVGQIGCCSDAIIKLRKYPMKFEVVKYRSLIACAARICHYRRKLGSLDASRLEEKWPEFLKWVEKRMEDEGYFQDKQHWLILKNTWNSDSSAVKLKKIKGSIRNLILSPIFYRTIWGRLWSSNLPLKLAKESSIIFKY